MINFLRWILCLPLGLLCAFLVHMLVMIALGSIHGFENIESFWAANDMAGMPISGTYSIIFIFTSAYISLIVFVVKFAPSHKQAVAKLISAVCALFLLGLTVYVFWLVFSNDVRIGFGVWYRSILEGISAATGIIVGYGISKDKASDLDILKSR